MTSHDSACLPAILGGPPICSAGPPPWPCSDPAVTDAIQRAVSDGSWGRYHDRHCKDLAEELKAYHNCDHVQLCASGTAAIELALRGLKVGPGDEVVMSAYDYKPNLQNVLITGAVPVLIDVHPANSNLDPALLAAAFSDRTRAVIASHLHGGIVPMPAVMDIARAHGVSVVEDACQLTGAVIDGRRAGMWGDAGVISFGGSKLLTSGRGGAVLSNDAGIVQRMHLYAFRGNEAYPLSELQAAALLPQLRQLDQRNQQRLRSASALASWLRANSSLIPFENAISDASPSYYKFGMHYNSDRMNGLSRDDFAAALRAEGIASDAGFRALHRIHSARRFRAVGELVHAERADLSVLNLHHPVLLEGFDAIETVQRAIMRVTRCADAIRCRLHASDGDDRFRKDGVD